MKYVKIVQLLALLAACSVAKPSHAEATPNYTGYLATYFQKTFGASASDTANLSVIHASYAETCPAGRLCIASGVYLVTYSDGDSEGQAVEFVGQGNCEGCLSVAIAGGGVIDTAELESLGLTAAEAQMLESN